MPQNNPRKANQTKTDGKTELASSELVGTSVPALVEGAKPEVIYYKPEEDQDIPKGRATRWLYYRSQIVLSVLTFAVVLFNAVQWRETRNTRELEFRAYVSVKGIDIQRKPNSPGFGQFVIGYINSGRTPAMNVTVLINTNMRENPIPDDVGFATPDSQPSKTVLAPLVDVTTAVGAFPINEPLPNLGTQMPSPQGGTEAQASPAPPPIQTPIPFISQDRKEYYVYGKIEYDDIFGNHHKTKFCLINTPFTTGFRSCSNYNTFD